MRRTLSATHRFAELRTWLSRLIAARDNISMNVRRSTTSVSAGESSITYNCSSSFVIHIYYSGRGRNRSENLFGTLLSKWGVLNKRVDLWVEDAKNLTWFVAVNFIPVCPTFSNSGQSSIFTIGSYPTRASRTTPQ